jgi:hypothetical protein
MPAQRTQKQSNMNTFAPKELEFRTIFRRAASEPPLFQNSAPVITGPPRSIDIHHEQKKLLREFRQHKKAVENALDVIDNRFAVLQHQHKESLDIIEKKVTVVKKQQEVWHSQDAINFEYAERKREQQEITLDQCQLDLDQIATYVQDTNGDTAANVMKLNRIENAVRDVRDMVEEVKKHLMEESEEDNEREEDELSNRSSSASPLPTQLRTAYVNYNDGPPRRTPSFRSPSPTITYWRTILATNARINNREEESRSNGSYHTPPDIIDLTGED